MTIRTSRDGKIELAGACPSADAETLLQLLLAHPGAAVDWQHCQDAHTAVVQVLIAAAVKPLGSPANARLKAWVAPILASPPDGAHASRGGIQ